MLRSHLLAAAAAAALAAFPAAAQHHDHGDAAAPAPSPSPTPAQDHSQHGAPAPAPVQDHSQHHMPMAPPPQDPHAGHDAMPAAPVLTGSGTSRLPSLDAGPSGGHGGAHLSAGDVMLMAHGTLWGVYTDQGGPRGDDMAFVESMAMLTAEARPSDRLRVQLRTMLSLEPLMGAPGYPNLFATGETANGAPLIDRQHPHDLFMELAGRVDWYVGQDRSFFVYGGPVGEPALGPSAFMHRRSARYLALAPITHHWFDSTHITYGVVTAGFSHPNFQIEASAFRGREPDEERWNIETPKLDSWSVRASVQPSPNWLVQVSHGRLESPEALHGGGDEARTTASVHYAGREVSAMLAFSAKNRIPGDTLTAWLGEVNWDISKHHSLFGRIENVANDELFPDHHDPLHDREFRLTRFEAGYAYRLGLGDSWNLALGGSVATYAKPQALDAAYGEDPFSYTVFARLSLGD